jgi:hypothetical protein
MTLPQVLRTSTCGDFILTLVITLFRLRKGLSEKIDGWNKNEFVLMSFRLRIPWQGNK